ncbi:MAG: serine O-acetyltransferase EpsC [Bacteroidales bacterium]|nr:serine O-acetyltransferase EpsC [Bacteroidales bacterium]
MNTPITPEHIAQLSAALTLPDGCIPAGTATGIDPRSVREAIELFRDLIFPGYFTDRPAVECLSKLARVLCEQIEESLAFTSLSLDAQVLTTRFMDTIPELRRVLSYDVRAMYDGDPAATSLEEVILCYPAIRAITGHRMAHALYQLQVPILPRIISEQAHAKTGIDIHPGATIGEGFAIDHGTGVVVGETCIIGRHVRLYQGVTLGARSLPKGEDGTLLNVPRHPIIEDRVIIYSNTSVLGRITIGHDSVVGGNVWQTSSLPPYSRVVQGKSGRPLLFEEGAGI